MEGNQVPRETVRLLVNDLDPEGVRERRAKTLRRRTYHTHLDPIIHGMLMAMINLSHMASLYTGVLMVTAETFYG
jgi:hypothetical protein